MLGQYAAVGSDNRIFVYEVTGLRQNAQTEGQQAPIRSSDSQFIQVPASRMNETMQRITKMGGKIANIRPLNGSAPEPTAAASEEGAEEGAEKGSAKRKRR